MRVARPCRACQRGRLTIKTTDTQTTDNQKSNEEESYLLNLCCVNHSLPPSRRTEQPNPLRFEVTVAAGLVSGPQNGRLFVMLNPRSRPEPRLTVGNTDADAPPVLARDITGFAPGRAEVIDNRAAIFPIESLAASARRRLFRASGIRYEH